MARLPTVGADSGNWGTVLNQYLQVGHNSDGSLNSVQSAYNVKDYGAKGDGSTDDTTAIQNAISAATGGGTIFLPQGTYLISSPLTLSVSGTHIVGSGRSNTLIRPSSSFSGAQHILLSGDFTGVTDLTIEYASSTTSTNPSTNAIQITAARSTILKNLAINYVNGWGVQSTSTNATANYWAHLENVHTYQCKQGIHIQGASGSGWNVGHALIHCNVDQTQGGDGFFFEDTHDILIMLMYGSVTSGSGSVIHIKGASAAIYMHDGDLGTSPGPTSGPTALIESGSNGTPRQVAFSNVILEGGQSGCRMTAGTQIHFTAVDFFNNGTYGCDVQGGDGINFAKCSFLQNGTVGTSGRYDFQSSTTGTVEVHGCQFSTPNGSTSSPASTNNAINVTAGKVSVHDNQFIGTGLNGSTIFAGYPKYIRNNMGYNPVGGFSAPVIGASPYTDGYKSGDTIVYVNGGTVSAVAIDGTTTGLTSGIFFLPAQSSITLTYSVTPTWVWYGL